MSSSSESLNGYRHRRVVITGLGAVTPLGNVRNGGVLKTWHGARMRQMREWHAGANFCAAQCQQCTEWSWWRPTPFGGGGPGGKGDRVAGEAAEA